MANLLPQSLQHDRFSRTVARMVVVTALLLLCTAAAGGIALVPAYVLLDAERTAIAKEIEVLNAAEVTADRDAVAAANKRIRIIRGIAERPSGFAEALARALDARPSGMSVRRVAYDSGFGSGTSTPGTLSVSGVFRDRDDREAYLASLRNIPLFTSADIPLSAFAQSDENAITVTARGAF